MKLSSAHSILRTFWSEMYANRKAIKSLAEADAFIDGRLKKWLDCLTKSVEVFGAEGPFFFGKISYVDFSLYNMLRNFEVMFGPDKLKKVGQIAPKILAIYTAIHTSKQLEEFVKTERPVIYASVLHTAF